MSPRPTCPSVCGMAVDLLYPMPTEPTKVAVNTDSIRDELDEVITLNSVSIIVAEYIPFGANQIVQLNPMWAVRSACRAASSVPAVDEDSSGTSMEMSPEMTAVDILDYTLDQSHQLRGRD